MNERGETGLKNRLASCAAQEKRTLCTQKDSDASLAHLPHTNLPASFLSTAGAAFAALTLRCSSSLPELSNGPTFAENDSGSTHFLVRCCCCCRIQAGSIFLVCCSCASLGLLCLVVLCFCGNGSSRPLTLVKIDHGFSVVRQLVSILITTLLCYHPIVLYVLYVWFSFLEIFDCLSHLHFFNCIAGNRRKCSVKLQYKTKKLVTGIGFDL